MPVYKSSPEASIIILKKGGRLIHRVQKKLVAKVNFSLAPK